MKKEREKESFFVYDKKEKKEVILIWMTIIKI